MTIIRLDIGDFRNITSAKLLPLSHGFNFIYGNNGSGKTSLLEAIHYLSLGRSFRSTLVNRVIQYTAEKFSLFAQIKTASNQVIPIGLERFKNGEAKLRIANNERKTHADSACLMPLLLINSQSYNLIEGPLFRRKYLDWGVFYLFPQFLEIWKNYTRVLKQRNAALRSQLPKNELESWTCKLVEYALQFDQLRREYVALLCPILETIIGQLLMLDSIHISYYSGWTEKSNFIDVLTESLERDKYLGYTQSGPHRADFKILTKGVVIKDILSRGQQKLFVCAMILAQGVLLKSHLNKDVTYLIDDLPSELDAMSRSKLLTLFSEQNAQIFVTAVEREMLEGFRAHAKMKMFHVEHGKIMEVINELNVK